MFGVFLGRGLSRRQSPAEIPVLKRFEACTHSTGGIPARSQISSFGEIIVAVEPATVTYDRIAGDGKGIRRVSGGILLLVVISG